MLRRNAEPIYFFVDGWCLQKNCNVKWLFMRNFVIVLMLFSMAAFAATPQKPLELGARLGANLMYLITDSEVDPYPSNAAFGGSLSFDVAYGLTSRLFIHSGIGLDYRLFMTYESEDATLPGCVENCERETCSENYEYFMGLFVEMPLLLQWRVPGVVFVEAGPVFSVLVATKGYGPVSGTPDSVEDLNNALGVSLAVGIGHKFNFGLSLDFRVFYLLTDLLDADAFGHFDLDGKFVPYGSYYNLLKFQIGVGYWF